MVCIDRTAADWNSKRLESEMNIIGQHSIVLSNPKYFNDKRDVKLAQEYIEARIQRMTPDEKERLYLIIKTDVDISKKDFNEKLLDIDWLTVVEKQCINENLGLLTRVACVTASMNDYFWENSDYGNDHKGYCIEYEFNKTDLEYLHPIYYTNEKIDIKNLRRKNAVILFKKKIEWEREREWRMVILQNNEKGFPDEHLEFYRAKVVAIHLGKNFDTLSEIGRSLYRICQNSNIPIKHLT